VQRIRIVGAVLGGAGELPPGWSPPCCRPGCAPDLTAVTRDSPLSDHPYPDALKRANDIYDRLVREMRSDLERRMRATHPERRAEEYPSSESRPLPTRFDPEP
jgi:hypothetical protein